MPEEHEEYASKFMLQEYTRIIDAYHDLHRQKDSLIKFYLAFVSLPVSVVGIYLALSSFLESSSLSGCSVSLQAWSTLKAIQRAGTFLSILLVLVGASVLMVMLRIREEQYLYVKTINAARKYFRDKGKIDATYLVLPSDIKSFTFAHDELWGRAFWEAMIVSITTSMLLGFLGYELLMRAGIYGYCLWVDAVIIFFAALFGSGLFIKRQLRAALRHHDLEDVESKSSSPKPPVQTPQSSQSPSQ